MFRPTTGELLGGVIDGLRQSVLSALPPGAAQRQLRASLHVLGRLERSWDLLPGYLDADGVDIRSTLSAILAALGPQHNVVMQGAAQKLNALKADSAAEIRGINAPSLAALCSIHEQLQALLAEVDAWLRAPERCDAAGCIEQALVLDKLYSRMSRRQLQAWGAEESDT